MSTRKTKADLERENSELREALGDAQRDARAANYEAEKAWATVDKLAGRAVVVNHYTVPAGTEIPAATEPVHNLQRWAGEFDEPLDTDPDPDELPTDPVALHSGLAHRLDEIWGDGWVPPDPPPAQPEVNPDEEPDSA